MRTVTVTDCIANISDLIEIMFCVSAMNMHGAYEQHVDVLTSLT